VAVLLVEAAIGARAGTHVVTSRDIDVAARAGRR